MEIWRHSFAKVGASAAHAARLESLGFDGLLLADTQMLTDEVYVVLTECAAATDRLRLGPGITNLVTRHPSVTAAAITAVNVLSGGRAVLGLGRGDSALTQVGLHTQTVREFAAGLPQLRGYLEALRTAHAGRTPVPIDIAASGPHVIEIAAGIADRITFTVGADAVRLRQAIDIAREARAHAGLDVDSLDLGAYVNVAPLQDLHRAADSVRGSAGIFARLAAESAAASESEHQARARYVEAEHGLSSAASAADLSLEFLSRFAIIGAPDRCVERILELRDLGLTHVVLVVGSRDTDSRLLDEMDEIIGTQLLPAL